jgi:hypothetical protein
MPIARLLAHRRLITVRLKWKRYYSFRRFLRHPRNGEIPLFSSVPNITQDFNNISDVYITHQGYL